MAVDARWEQIRRLPIDHTFTTSSTNEVYSAQWLTVPLSWLPQGFHLTESRLETLGPFYFRRLMALSGRFIQVREEEHEICFEVALVRLPLLCFAPAQTTEKQGGGTVCYAITGGLMLAPGAPEGGMLCMSLLPTDAGLRVGMEVQQYHARIAGTDSTRRFRRWLYEMTQARLHHIIANDFVRQLAMALVTGR
ncbi:MAG: hypothetical protein H0T73_08785 [Ardenticatenales bacterium]|nr:hypothetical protein [Ardenticatenales bacterium]